MNSKNRGSPNTDGIANKAIDRTAYGGPVMAGIRVALRATRTGRAVPSPMVRCALNRAPRTIGLERQVASAWLSPRFATRRSARPVRSGRFAAQSAATLSAWAGLATTKRPYHLKNSLTGPQVQLVQRSGERPETYTFKNIRYGQMTMALLAQTAIHQLRQRLGSPYATWDAKHLARSIFNGIDGDLCVHHDTVVVTLYNAPHPDLLRQHDEHLPEKLAAERVNPHVPHGETHGLD